MIAGTLEIQLLANMARLQKDMDDAKRAVGGAMADIERHVGAAKAALGGLAAGLLGGLSVAGLVNVAEKAIDAADAMNDLSQRVGISVKDLAKYELASKQSGTSMESLSKGIKGLAGNLMEHGDALKKAGITATEADGAIKQLAAVFAALPDGMEKTTLAVKLFGKSGMDLIPMLNMGAEGLEKAAEKSAKYASQMAAMAPMADAYNDNMAELAMHNKVASMSMLNELLPALVAITGAMADAAKNGGFLKGVMAGLDEFGNRAFDWSGNNARKEIRTLTKDLEDLQVQQSRITIDIFGAKGSIQTQIEEKTKALEAARKAYYGFTDGSAGGGRGSVNPPNVKPATDPLADYKALMAAMEGPKKKSDDANKELEKQAKLLAELAGLTGGFAEDWARLNTIFAAGKLTTEQLTAAQAALLAKQPAIQAATKAETEAEKAYTKEMEDQLQVMKKLYAEDEARTKSARGMLDQLEFEISLLGMTTEQRALANAERELERQGIVAGTEAYDKYITKIRQAVVDKSAMEQWQATWQSIDATAHDVFVNIFEGGQSAFKKLGSVLKASLLDWLYQMTVKKWIISIGASMSGGSALAGGGGAMGLGGTVNSAMGLNTLYGAGAQWLGGASAGASSLSLGYANAVGAVGGDSLGALISANGGWAGVSTGAAAAEGAGAAAAGSTAAGAGGISGALAAVPVWGWIALAAIAIASQAKGETRSGGQYSYDANKGVASLLQGPSGGEIQGDVVKQSIAGTAGGINGLLKAMGSSATLAGFQAGLESSDRGRGGVFSGGTLSTGQTFGENGLGNNYDGTLYEQTSAQSVDAKDALTNFTTDLMQVTIQALQAAADIPKTIADMVQGVDAESLSADAAKALVGTIEATVAGINSFRDAVDSLPFESLKDMSFDAAAGLIAAAGGMDKLGAGLSSYYDSWYTDAEKAANSTAKVSKVFEGLGLTMPDLSAGADAVRETFRAMVDGAMADTTAKGQQTTVALLGVSSALAGLVTSSASASASVANVGQSVGFDGRTVLGAADAAMYKADAGFAHMIDGLQAMADVTNAAMRPAGDGGYGTYSEIASRNTSGGGTMPDYTKELADAQNKLTAAQQSATDALSKFTGSLMDFITQMNVTELGANSPEMRLAASRAEYERIYKEVSSGDLSEKDKLTGAAKTFLDASKSYNASGAGFVADEGYIRQTIGSVIESNQAQLNAPAWSAAALTQYGKGEGVAELIEQIKTLNAKIANIERNTGDQVAVAQDAGTQTVEQLKAGNAQQAQALSNAKFEALRNV